MSRQVRRSWAASPTTGGYDRTNRSRVRNPDAPGQARPPSSLLHLAVFRVGFGRGWRRAIHEGDRIDDRQVAIRESFHQRRFDREHKGHLLTARVGTEV